MHVKRPEVVPCGRGRPRAGARVSERFRGLGVERAVARRTTSDCRRDVSASESRSLCRSSTTSNESSSSSSRSSSRVAVAAEHRARPRAYARALSVSPRRPARRPPRRRRRRRRRRRARRPAPPSSCDRAAPSAARPRPRPRATRRARPAARRAPHGVTRARARSSPRRAQPVLDGSATAPPGDGGAREQRLDIIAFSPANAELSSSSSSYTLRKLRSDGRVSSAAAPATAAARSNSSSPSSPPSPPSLTSLTSLPPRSPRTRSRARPPRSARAAAARSACRSCRRTRTQPCRTGLRVGHAGACGRASCRAEVAHHLPDVARRDRDRELARRPAAAAAARLVVVHIVEAAERCRARSGCNGTERPEPVTVANLPPEAISPCAGRGAGARRRGTRAAAARRRRASPVERGDRCAAAAAAALAGGRARGRHHLVRVGQERGQPRAHDRAGRARRRRGGRARHARPASAAAERDLPQVLRLGDRALRSGLRRHEEGRAGTGGGARSRRRRARLALRVLAQLGVRRPALDVPPGGSARAPPRKPA